MTFYRLDFMQIVLGLSHLYQIVHCMLELLLRFYSTSPHEGRRLTASTQSSKVHPFRPHRHRLVDNMYLTQLP